MKPSLPPNRIIHFLAVVFMTASLLLFAWWVKLNQVTPRQTSPQYVSSAAKMIDGRFSRLGMPQNKSLDEYPGELTTLILCVVAVTFVWVLPKPATSHIVQFIFSCALRAPPATNLPS